MLLQSFVTDCDGVWIFRNNCYDTAAPSAEMLGEFQPLALVIGTKGGAVTFRGRIGQPLKHQSADDLAVLQDERDLTGAHFQHASG